MLCAFVPVCIGETRRRLCTTAMGCITCGFWGHSRWEVGIARVGAPATAVVHCLLLFGCSALFASVLGSMRSRISVKMKYDISVCSGVTSNSISSTLFLHGALCFCYYSVWLINRDKNFCNNYKATRVRTKKYTSSAKASFCYNAKSHLARLKCNTFKTSG